jgi:hypothetical protein
VATLPSTSIELSSAGRTSAIARNNVVFPDPTGPIRATLSPGAIEKSAWRRPQVSVTKRVNRAWPGVITR